MATGADVQTRSSLAHSCVCAQNLLDSGAVSMRSCAYCLLTQRALVQELLEPVLLEKSYGSHV